jgi:hypothetical protein
VTSALDQKVVLPSIRPLWSAPIDRTNDPPSVHITVAMAMMGGFWETMSGPRRACEQLGLDLSCNVAYADTPRYFTPEGVRQHYMALRHHNRREFDAIR